jgi:putative ABC transport system permease protein
MNYGNLLKIALRAIHANRMRSFLTALGIIIGVASVITMLAIGQGSKKSIQANISEMGSNMIMISPGADMRGGVRQDASSMETLKQTDYQSIKDNCNYVSAVSPTVNSSGQWIYGSNNTPSSVYGVNLDYLTIRQLSVDDGEMFTENDIKTSAKVCVLGQTIVDNLFPDGSDPVGRVVRFNSIPFRVVGVLKKKGYNSMGMDQDDLALAPYTTVMKRILAQTYLGGIVCSAITEGVTDNAVTEITSILRHNHKLKDATDTQQADDDDFNIRSQEELSSMMNSTTDMLTILLGCVAGISLIVGGIGIMNIMYVSVTERTREIGLRMSVGARGIDILNQFLIEAILLSVTGGIIGVILGIGSSYAVKLLAHWPIYIQMWSIIMSFAVCVFTGVFFGWYPAKKAAQLDPIDNHKEMMKVELAMHNKDMHKFKDNKKFIIFGYFRDFYNLSLAAVIAYSMIMSRNLIISENARKEAEAARMDAELSNLRYQINPHFLLNTLNNIYALISFNTNKAQTSILELSKMMRYMLYDNQQKLTNLKNETNFIHNYINLMKIRLTPNIKVEEHINIPEPCTIQIAPLIFISLIENAFKHGISPTEPSFINVRIDANNERIICDIKNSNFPKNEQDRSGHGIGLEQVQKRLNLSYPGKYEWKNNIDKQENIYQSTIIIYDTKLCNS